MSILFKDIAKKANDLLGKNFTTDSKKKFSVKTATAGGITYKAEGTISGDKLAGKIGAEIKHDSGFTVKKVELNNKGELTSEITLDKAVDDVRFTLDVKLAPLETVDPKEETKIGVIYTQPDYKASVQVSPLDPTSAKASVCFNKDGFNVGGTGYVEYDTEAGEVSKHGYGFGVGYSADNSVSAIKLSKCPSDNNVLTGYQFSFFRQHTDAIAFAATLGGKINPKEGQSPSARLQFGGSYKVDSSSTLYAKLSAPNGTTAGSKASFNYDSQLSDSTKLGVTAVVGLDGSSAPAFGVNLGFGF